VRRAWLGLLLLTLPAWAADPSLADEQQAQVEALRGEVAGQIQLQAFDLLDELVHGWTQQPPFPLDTAVVLAEVSVPVGFGSGLQALVENHFAALAINNPRTRVKLVHCPQCTASVVHSGARGTIIARGVDQPEALARAGALTASRHALFLDFEAEGASLVLRTRITSLEPALPIVYARTLSTSTSSAALLRSGERLKSAAEARQEYLEALQGRGTFVVPLRLGVRTYASGDGTVRVPPFLWLQLGAEAALSQARAWTASFSVGASWAPQLHTGLLVQTRISRLLSGSVASLTHPDVYAYVGGSIISISGQSALLFRDRVPDLQDVLAGTQGTAPRTTFGAIQVGLEVRVKNRIAAGAYLESMPTMNNAPALGTYLDTGILQFQSVGAEVSFCF